MENTEEKTLFNVSVLDEATSVMAQMESFDEIGKVAYAIAAVATDNATFAFLLVQALRYFNENPSARKKCEENRFPDFNSLLKDEHNDK